MDTFETSLILETDSSKEIKLSNTKKILLTKNKYTIHKSKYIYSIEDTRLVIYRIHSYKEVYCTEIKMDIDIILSIDGDIYCVSENRLIKNIKESVPLNKEGTDKLININNNIGIQYKNKLEIYDRDLIKINEYDCNVSFYIEDILILGTKNILRIFIRDQSLEIYLEEDIKCITSDYLFSAIYCGSSSGKIYKINMDKSKNEILEYHVTDVKYLKMSICNGFLYSCDSDNNILIWDTVFNIVLDRIRMDTEVRNMDCFLMSQTLSEEKIPIRDI